VALARGVAVWPDGSITRTIALLCEVCDQLAAPDHDCGSDVRQLLQLAANTVNPSPGLDRIRRETQATPTPSERSN
jgi:ABC-type transporter Mla subunit MlaD